MRECLAYTWIAAYFAAPIYLTLTASPRITPNYYDAPLVRQERKA